MLWRNVVKKKKKSFRIIEAIVENDVLFGGMKEEVDIAAYTTCIDTEVFISLPPIRRGWQICA